MLKLHLAPRAVSLSFARSDKPAMLRTALLAGMVWVLPALGSAGDVSGIGRAGGKPVQHAVVWLELGRPEAFAQTSRIVMDQRNLAFYPHVLVVRVGTTVDFPNSDKV